MTDLFASCVELRNILEHTSDPDLRTRLIEFAANSLPQSEDDLLSSRIAVATEALRIEVDMLAKAEDSWTNEEGIRAGLLENMTSKGDVFARHFFYFERGILGDHAKLVAALQGPSRIAAFEAISDHVVQGEVRRDILQFFNHLLIPFVTYPVRESWQLRVADIVDCLEGRRAFLCGYHIRVAERVIDPGFAIEGKPPVWEPLIETP